MKDYKTPEFIRLGTGGDIYSWLVQMQTHFESKGTWDFVNEIEDLKRSHGPRLGYATIMSEQYHRDKPMKA